ncbi:hypothetical protein MUU74_06945 [Chryseobacterium daecheongense]|uniref:DUF6759 domain-containing protein n=1 Tax=Chryseobacterium daecheongense TaxID=192389 RepID=UPI001FD712CB|nr:DUF6759 domain-containing protein [Chryseobacterium daecheongense]UOU99685.1 hypothetical protein MUU74_06945 [Chryseobacterium daecheongense]
MKKLLPFSLAIIALLMDSCGSVNYNKKYPERKPSPPSANTGSRNTSASQVEREYQALIKTYKPETAEVLTDLLNDSSDSPKTSITVENNSRCNMVLTISGTNYFKKIPIGANKIGSAMVLKNQNYNFSGMVCNSVYQKTKFITSSYNITLSN